MRTELKNIINKMKLIEPVRISNTEEIRKQYSDGKYPDNIKEVFDGFSDNDSFFVRYADADEFSNAEMSLLIQLKSYEKISKIHSYLLFFVMIM